MLGFKWYEIPKPFENVRSAIIHVEEYKTYNWRNKQWKHLFLLRAAIDHWDKDNTKAMNIAEANGSLKKPNQTHTPDPICVFILILIFSSSFFGN